MGDDQTIGASVLARLLAAPFIALILMYRVLLSPVMGGHCRFHPSCSQYALDAYRDYNPVRASWLTLRRLLRCHPLGGSGYDPVPPGRDAPGPTCPPEEQPPPTRESTNGAGANRVP